ncbi:MAG: hypothetical protein ABIT05_11145 [Chitinophagaceae bacterium]
MEKKPATAAGVTDTAISLKQLVTNLVNHSQLAALNHQSNLVNEVEQDLVLGTDSPRIMSIMSDLLHTVVSNSKNGEIHISADRYNGVVILQIQERNNYNGYALAYSIGSIEPDAIKIGGHISIKGPQQKITTISFSFPTQFAA